MKRTPTTPSKAHHRLMGYIVNMMKKGYDPTPKQLDLCGRVFVRAGGSWEKLFQGGVADMDTLKKVLQVAAKRGVFNKSPKW